MTLKKTVFLIALAFGTSAVAGTPVGNVAAGKDKASKACAACHGADGNQTLDGSYPRLAGQYPDYVAKVLHDYKSGKRNNPIMVGQAQGLSDQDIADLSAYFGSVRGQIHDLSAHAR